MANRDRADPGPLTGLLYRGALPPDGAYAGDLMAARPGGVFFVLTCSPTTGGGGGGEAAEQGGTHNNKSTGHKGEEEAAHETLPTRAAAANSYRRYTREG